MNASTRHRLDGLEPDNLLAFFALLGLLRALDAADRQVVDERLAPRAAWDLDNPPLRPVLALQVPRTQDEVVELAARGIDALAGAYEFEGAKDLSFDRDVCRDLLMQEANAASGEAHDRVDLVTALMSDALVKDPKTEAIQPTPLCVQLGQGHQHFLERLATVPHEPSPPARGRGRSKRTISAAECLAEAVFHPWHRRDPTFSFRWDPDEDVRYALMAGDPTDSAYKTGTQHGANRLAALGLAALTLVPAKRRGRPRPLILGGDVERGFSFAWPVWREPTTLAAVRALLAHPDLRTPGALGHLGVQHVFVARRISVGRYMNFTRGRLLVGNAGVSDDVSDGELHQ